MPDPAAPGPASSNALPVVDTGKPANPAADAPLATTLYPGGADNEKGGGTVAPPPADPAASTSAEPKAAAAEPPVEPAKPPGEGEPAKPDGAEAAPPLSVESYAKLTLPEGFEVNDALLGDFKKLSAETGIAPEAAQNLMNLYGRAMQEQTRALTEAWNATQSKWTADLNAMPEFQGERRAQTETVLAKVVEEFTASPAAAAELKAVLNSTGMGNNPHLVRLIYDMASALVEDEPPAPGQPAAASRRGRSLGEILYPTPPN